MVSRREFFVRAPLAVGVVPAALKTVSAPPPPLPPLIIRGGMVLEGVVVKNRAVWFYDGILRGCRFINCKLRLMGDGPGTIMYNSFERRPSWLGRILERYGAQS